MSETNNELAEKRLEASLRKKARRRGFMIRKNRCRNPMAMDWGTYCVVDERNCLVVGNSITGFGAGLNDIAEFLKEEAT